MELVGAWRFELQTSCAQGSCKNSILLARLALCCVIVLGFGPKLALLRLKLDPSFGLAPDGETRSLRAPAFSGFSVGSRINI